MDFLIYQVFYKEYLKIQLTLFLDIKMVLMILINQNI